MDNKTIEVTNLEDERLDVYRKLTEHQLRNKLEPEQGILIVESEIAIRVALAHGLKPLSFLINKNHAQSMADVLQTIDPDVPIFVIAPELASQLVGYSVHRSIFCAMRRPSTPGAQEVASHAKRLAVLEGIVDTTNVGAIFRNAAALGCDGLLLSPTCCDPWSRRAIRVSMGNVFLIPWARLGDGWPTTCFDLLAKKGFYTAALALDERAKTLDAISGERHEKLALFLGTEGTGLSQEVIAATHDTVIIPMQRGVDSLNVAAASAVAFWELYAKNGSV